MNTTYCGYEIESFRQLTDPATVNVELLQRTLDGITADHVRWNQGGWCKIPGGVDALTAADVATGTYHGFDIPPSLNPKYDYALPIADCGTSFCVAGDVCVRSGYAFVGTAMTTGAASVVPAARVVDFLRQQHLQFRLGYIPVTIPVEEYVVAETASVVACAELRLAPGDAERLFNGSNTLVDVWAIAYAASGAQLTLPAELPEIPETELAYGSPAVPDAAEVRHRIMTRVAELSSRTGCHHWSLAVDLDALRCQHDYEDCYHESMRADVRQRRRRYVGHPTEVTA